MGFAEATRRQNRTGLIEEMNGGAEGTRTLDPHVANVVLSQLSYCPTVLEGGIVRGGAGVGKAAGSSVFPGVSPGASPAASSPSTVRSPSVLARRAARSPISSWRWAEISPPT